MLDQSDVNVWQDLFTSIIEDADSNILLLDEEFNILALNPGFYWIFMETYKVELRRGSSIIQALEKVDQRITRLWKQRCHTAMSGTSIKVEDVFEMDGRFFYWEIHYKADTLPDGKQVVSVYSRDITIRKAYQKRIVENEANLRSILDTIENSVWLVNTDYELIDFNRNFLKHHRQTYGIRPTRRAKVTEIIPESMTELRAQWLSRYESGLTGKPGKYIDAYKVAGDLRTFEVRTYPIMEHGNVRGLTVYSRDITLMKKAEDQLKQQNEELTKINCELDRFVYSASHDLRAPLLSVKGLLNMIKIDPDKNSLEKYLHLIETSVNRLDNFITDIIHYSRNSRMDIIPKAIDFQEIVNESIQSLKFMAQAEQVKSIINIEVDEPFYSDASRLLIIFNNIIANAVHYRDKWKESFLEISIEIKLGVAVIRFRDNGMGIADEHQAKIFKMFYRAHADSKGSGLGLYIVKSTVEKLGGRIWLESKLGAGTTFFVEVPNLNMILN